MINTRTTLAACLLAIASFTACDKNNDDELNNVDRDYMVKASIGNSAEVDAATLAASKATNTQVKTFAQHMLMEHGMSQTELKQLSANVGYAVKDTIDPAHVALKTQLSALSGRQFDSAYIYAQVADHQTTINNFQTEISSGQHKDVKNYANNYLPHIQMHYQSADSISKAFFRR